MTFRSEYLTTFPTFPMVVGLLVFPLLFKLICTPKCKNYDRSGVGGKERVFEQVPVDNISRQNREWQKGFRMTKTRTIGKWLDLMVQDL